jgi:1-deoxy-D-xylulose-5-phosphate synthase
MSISNNVGGLSHYLSKIRNRKGYFKLKDGLRSVLNKIPLGKKIERTLTKFKQMLKGTIYKSNFFEDLGFVYLGPIDGHNIKQLTEIFERAKKLNQPVVIHVNTVKGKGYAFAENSPSDFHGVSKFDHINGDLNKSAENFTEHFSSALLELANNNDKICAVTAAMKDSTGLLEFSKKYPQRFFDVGIAEEHAVTFCAALAQKSYVPVLAIYSTFLQRAYDQIVHDVAIENQHVVFAVDRAGIVGEDGETHQGIFDVAFLTHIPNITVFSPSDYTQLKECLTRAVCDCNGPVAVRYPRGGIEKIDITAKQFDGFEVLENENAKTVILTYGRLFQQAVKACDVLSKNKKDVCVVNLIKIHPLPFECIEYLKKFQNVFLFEEGIENGSVSQKIVNMLYNSGYCGKTKITAINDKFVPHSSVKQALKDLKLDCDGMVEVITNTEEI